MFESRVELEVSILIDCIFDSCVGRRSHIFDSRKDSETSNFSVITFLPHLSDISPYRNAPVPVVIPIERALSNVTCHERKRKPAYLFVFVQTESDNPILPLPMDEPMPMEGAYLTPSTSDNFTDAQHKRKDEEVTQAASKFFAGQQDSEWSEFHYAFLLQCIIKHSEGKLQVAFMDNGKAIDLMRANPKLGSVLKKAWRTKDYKEIRKSGEFRASVLAGS